MKKSESGNQCESCKDESFVYKPGEGGCTNRLMNDALELINRQKAEIERLQKHNEMVLENCRQYNEANDKSSNQRFLEAINVVKSEAIKEFVERLKKKTYPFPCVIGVENAVTIRAINDLVKEMTEEKQKNDFKE